ncbi:dihydroorotase [Geomonas sp. RF6]|uniref:dihydroorotase n=1 Tax=Geomonas sp. RF6 TaxID=2897342 RepID=UPI001E2E08F9|nr:dihydroorotase [Geomonas sp. RF6]UFS70477.1 dihydroorotase [Geomonas sp. RF6]
MNLLIKGGRLIDPSQGIDSVTDILIADGVVMEIGSDLVAPATTPVIDAAGLVVAPGLIDMHVHLRDPGLEYKEDIASGSRAAAAGGFTSIACMPNTSPVNDNKAVTSYILNRAEKEAVVNVFPVGCITKGGKGESLAEIGTLKEAGCVAVSDDGKPVSDADLMRRALEYARGIGIAVISHSEEMSLAGEGVMNEGAVSTELGLKGIPWAAEDVAVARDVYLAEFTGSPVHIAHISTQGSARIIRNAKARGVKVTCETAPHYFTLTDEAVRGYNTNAKMNPPLRGADDVAAMKVALADGTIDAIATDHAPHHADEKDVEYPLAMNGIVGLETSLPLTLALVEEGVLDLQGLVTVMSCNPAKILGIARGTLKPGAIADVTIIDPQREWMLDAASLNSKSKNTPFLGCRLKGAAAYTIVKGQVVHQG